VRIGAKAKVLPGKNVVFLLSLKKPKKQSLMILTFILILAFDFQKKKKKIQICFNYLLKPTSYLIEVPPGWKSLL